MRINSINIENFFDLPAFVFLKDAHGKYHACNDYVEKYAGEKASDIIGTTDRDRCWKDNADFYQFMDNKVINQEKPLIFIEKIRTIDQSERSALTCKIPTIFSRKKLVFGISFFLEKVNDNVINQLRILFNTTPRDIIEINQLPSNNIKLTERQIDRLYYLVNGMTMKEIARTLSLSPKTIEHYLYAIKLKLNCNNRADLIKKALQLPCIKYRLRL